MCNNVAIISKDPTAYRSLISQFKLALALGRNNGNRGTGFYHNTRHVTSTGYSLVDNTVNTHDSLDFLVEDGAWFFETTPSNVFMGHNRAPSAGMGSGADFVHPFKYQIEEFDADEEVVESEVEIENASKEDENPYILGGAEIYTQAIKIADKLDLTFVHHKFEADALFPKIDLNIWQEETRENFEADENNKYNYSFVTYLKK